MPVVHKSTIKRAKQAERRHQRNRAVLSSVKGVMKKVITAVEQKNKNAAQESLREAAAAISKAVTKGVLKRNTASRRISLLATKVKTLATART